MKALRLALPLVVLVAACADSGHRSDQAGGEPHAGVGITQCFGCHADSNNPAGFPPVFGDSASSLGDGLGWLSGPHANNETLTPTFEVVDSSPSNTGFPSYGFEGLGQVPGCTLGCHDQLGDGLLLQDFYLESGSDALGTVNRPVVGCESCHGGGAGHFGANAPPPNPVPGVQQCAQCHNAQFPSGHLEFHPEGSSIAESYRTSPHARSILAANYVDGSTTDVQARCSRCHTDEGARKYIHLVSGTESHDDLVAALDGQSDVADASPIECRTCHDGHNPERLLGDSIAGLPGSWSSEFKTCTACHQLLDAQGNLNRAGYHDPSVNAHGSVDQIIVDTHWDDPSTPGIEGYVVDPASGHDALAGNTNSGTCRDCHNPHDADTTNNREWAMSGHAGRLGQLKAADRGAAVGEETGPAWTHYDFKGTDRADCQRCHTSTGFRNFANDPAHYDPAKNVFVATGQQKEMLYCWACHVSNTGNIRNPGPFPGTAPYDVPADRIAAVPDLHGSNLCMSCHSGRESGAQIAALAYPDAIVGKNFGSFNSHYLAAGGILFRTIGFEFEGRDYANVSFFAHDQIGSAAAPGTGSNGPCVGCHMAGDAGHTFDALERGPDDSIIKINAQQATCQSCHSGDHAITVADLEELDVQYEAALDALEAAFAPHGIYYAPTYPYFFSTSDPAQQTPAAAFTAWPNKETLGAAFNLNLFRNQPAGAVHNRFYVKKLVYDSIDFLDDGSFDGSVEATLGSGPAFDFLQGTRS